MKGIKEKVKKKKVIYIKYIHTHPKIRNEEEKQRRAYATYSIDKGVISLIYKEVLIITEAN